MHHRALGLGQGVLGSLDLQGRRHLADLGGGPGTYSVLLCQKYPQLRATLFDLPPVVEIAQEIVASMGASERVSCCPYDYYQGGLEGRYDAVLISGVLHREQPGQVRDLLKQAVEILEPGGVLYLSDVMLDDARTGPLFGTMFALNMRVLSHGGRCHSVAEQRGWLEELGLQVKQVIQLPPPIHYTIIQAERV